MILLCVLLFLFILVNVTSMNNKRDNLMNNFNEPYCQQQGHAQANGENILLVTMARNQHIVEDPDKQRLVFLYKNGPYLFFLKSGRVSAKVKKILLCCFLSSSDDFKLEVKSAGNGAVMLLLDSSDPSSWCVPNPSGFVCSSQISASGLAALLHSWFIFIEFVLHGPDLTLHFNIGLSLL